MLPSHTAGIGGQGASTVTGGDSEDSGSTGVSIQEGVDTELRLLLGRYCLFSLLKPHCGASHLSLLHLQRKAPFAPGDIKDPRPSAHQAAFRALVCADPQHIKQLSEPRFVSLLSVAQWFPT